MEYWAGKYGYISRIASRVGGEERAMIGLLLRWSRDSYFPYMCYEFAEEGFGNDRSFIKRRD